MQKGIIEGAEAQRGLYFRNIILVAVCRTV